MRLMIVTNEEFPTNRPMLSELWNREFTRRGHTILWIMKGKAGTRSVSLKPWEANTVVVLPNYGASVTGKTLTHLFRFYYYLTHIIPLFKREKIDLGHIHNSTAAGMILSVFSMMTSLRFTFAITFPFNLLYKIQAGEKFSLFRYLRGAYYHHAFGMIFKHSSLILPISDYYKKALEMEYRLPGAKFFPVSESASSHFLAYQPNKRIDPSTKKFIYVGEMSCNRKLTVILDAFRIVINDHPDAELHLIGWGLTSTDVPALQNYASDLHMQGSVKFFGKIDYSLIPDRICDCVAGLSPIPPIEMYMISTPTKCIDYLSIGIPVIANREIYDQKCLIEKSGGGILVDFDARQFADGMLRLLSNRSAAKIMGEQGRKWVRDNRSFTQSAGRIEERLVQLM